MVETHFDRLMAKQYADGVEQGVERGSIDTAKRMLAKGKLSIEEIAEYSSLSVDEIRELAKGA